MVITAKELLNLQQSLLIIIDDEEVDLKGNIFTLDGDEEEDDRSDPVEVIMFDLYDSGNVYYCLPDEIVILDDQGVGLIEVYLDRYVYLPVDKRKSIFTIKVKTLIPFTDAIRTKLLLGIL